MIVTNDDSEMQEAHLKYRTRAELQSKGLKKKFVRVLHPILDFKKNRSLVAKRRLNNGHPVFRTEEIKVETSTKLLNR